MSTSHQIKTIQILLIRCRLYLVNVLPICQWQSFQFIRNHSLGFCLILSTSYKQKYSCESHQYYAVIIHWLIALKSTQALIPRSNVGQVAHVSPTPCVTSQEADITRRSLEAACSLRLGCWSNNSANSHPRLGALNRRVLRACLVPQCSYPPHPPRHQRRLTNCDWMPAASYTSGQPSNPRRHPTCWASSQWSHAVSSTPCHGACTFSPHSADLSIDCKGTAPQIETPISTRRTTSHQFIWQQQHTYGAVGGSPMECGVVGKTHKAPHWHPRHRHTNGMTLPRRAWIWLNRLRTGVGRFRSFLYKWGTASSAACECGAEEQTVDHVVHQHPIHRPPHGLHGLTILDDETIQRLLNTCTEI